MNLIPCTSSRINLRLVTIKDLNLVHELHLLPAVDEFNTLGIPKNIAETQSVLEGWVMANEQEPISNYTFAIELVINNETQFIGLMGLKLWPKKYKRGEVWYKIHSDYWNNGFATETLNLILNFGFGKLDLHRIQAGCAVDNIASIKVLEKVGMLKEGRGRQILPLKTGWSDNFEFAILKTDLRKNR